MEETFIKLYRKLLKWRWADDPNTFALWIRLLLLANFEDKGWHNITIKRGQVVTSVAKLAIESGLSKQQTRTCLDRLKDTQAIVMEATNKYTIITICNYDSYQSFECSSQQTNNKQITNEQQTNNKQITTTKEREEREESKEDISPLFVPPTVDDVIAYCQERNNGVDAVRFVSYYESVGWKVGKNKMKDWKAAVRTWERKYKQEHQAQPPQQQPGCIWSTAEQRWIPI